MQTAAAPKRLPSHLAVNSRHIANGKEIVGHGKMQTAPTPKWVSSHRTVNSVVVVVVVVVVILVIVVIVVVVVVIVIIVVRTQCLRYGGCVSWSPPPLTNATARTHAQNHTQSNA